ncbi:MAG: FAD-binding oxidoreductase [Burkholderiales bacterium]|nr:FAD-binding oxidoreductase [Burkholderiales bacterium]
MSEVIERLAAELADITLVRDPAQVTRLSRDFYWFSPILKNLLDDKRADLAAVPATQDEAVRVVAACARAGVPVTPRGLGSGNYGQAVPLAGGLVLDTSRLDRVLWVRPGAARAEAGTRMSLLDDAARASGWEQRMLPSTFRGSSVGGFYCGGGVGIGSNNYGMLKDPGNILGVKALSMHAEPRIVELRGRDAVDMHHAYGVNGIVLEVELALAPALPWIECMASFADFDAAVAFAQALGEADGIAKKGISAHQWPLPRSYRPLKDVVVAGESVVMTLVAAHNEGAFTDLVAAMGGRITWRNDPAAAGAKRLTLREFMWNHATLHAIREAEAQGVAPGMAGGITYLQLGYPAGRNLELVRRIHEIFGDEIVQHVEFIRVKGAMTCSGLPIVRWSDEARLREVMRRLEEEGVYIADPHTWVVEDGGKKSINPRHVELKLAMDPAGLINPGKLRAWDERGVAQKKSVFWDS